MDTIRKTADYPIRHYTKKKRETGEGEDGQTKQMRKRKEQRLTFTRMLEIIQTISIRNHIFPQTNTRRKFRLQDITLIEEQDQIRRSE